MSNTVTKNKAVYFTYTVTNQTGETMEQSDVPVGYVHGGSSDLLPKLEQSLDDLKVGDEVDVVITPEEGFGQADPNMIHREKLDSVPPEYRRIGAEAQFQNENGEAKVFVVTGFEKGMIIMDGNHPYAGKTVTFHVVINEIRDADSEELKTGRVKDGIPKPH